MKLLLGQWHKISDRKTQVIQNKIIKIINFKCWNDRVKMNKLYKSMNILQIKDIFELKMSKFMHSFYHKKLSEVFDNYISKLLTNITAMSLDQYLRKIIFFKE